MLQDQAMEQKYWAHGGMLKTAKAIWQDLEVQPTHPGLYQCLPKLHVHPYMSMTLASVAFAHGTALDVISAVELEAICRRCMQKPIAEDQSLAMHV